MANPVLELKNVIKRFGTLTILRGINLTLLGGEAVAIMGPSGVGKSTLLHVAGLMEHPTEGSVVIDGNSASLFSEKQLSSERLDTIGFLFQFHYLLPEFTALENVLLPTRLAGDNLENKRKEAISLLTEMKMEYRLNHFPNQLSGGEQQRTALARAMIRNPKLLLLDEPTGNLDHDSATSMMKLIWDQIKERRLSAIVVTHNPIIAQQADRLYRMMDGRFVS